MHKHLSTSDAGQQHFLKSSFGLANPRQQQQQQQPSHARISSGSTRAAAASGSSTPNSLYGFTPVSPTSPGGDDAIAQAWEAVEQFYSSPNPPAAAATAQYRQRSSSSRHQQQHYPSLPGADPAYGSRSPQRQSQGDSHVNAAAAVQFAAGVSLNTGAHGSRQQPYSYIPDALPVSTAAHSSRDRTSQQQQQQQQQEDGWAEQLGGVQGALGVQLMAGSGSIMAAMGGWVVNQAISAAATTATAALSGPAVPESAARTSSSSNSQQPSKAAAAAAAAVGGAAAAAATSPPAAEQGGGSSGGGSSSWWRRFSSRASESQIDAQPAAPAAGDTGAKKSSGIKGSLKAAAKRHGLRKKAAANAAAGGGARGPSYDDNDEDLSPGVGSEAGSGSEGFRSEGSAEYSQLLSQMDSELRDAAAAGAAAAVSGGTPGVTARRGLGKARTSAAATAAAAAAGGYSDITLDDDDSFMEDDVQIQMSGQSRGGSWLAAVGLGPRASSSSLNTATAAAAAAAGGGGSSGGGSYLWVDHETGSALADRAKVLRGVLLWRSPGTSAKALGLGIYIIMLLGSIPRALHYMQVTTVLPGIALLYLTYNMAKPWTIKLYCSFISPASDAVRLQARLSLAEEAAARAVVWFAARAAVEAGSWSLALLALAHRALRARRFTTSCWTFVALWLLLLVSELRVMNQTLLAMIAYAGLFCVPWLYKQFRSVIDKVVYDILHFMTLLLVNAERWAYALAVLAAALTWQLFEPADGASTGASLVVRCTASGIAGLGVLLWRLLVAE